VMANPRMADLRNIYDREDTLAAGFQVYEGVGRAQHVSATNVTRDVAE